MQITMQRKLSFDTVADLYPRYTKAWETLLTEAAARHVLSEEEFHEEMADERLEKYLVVDDSDRIVGMTTLTTDLAAIPWINPLFYRHRFPEQQEQGSLFYLGYTFVDTDHRRSIALSLMAGAINQRLAEARGVIGFDICGFNTVHGIGAHLGRLFSAGSAVATLDTQTYFTADYRNPRKLRDLRTAANSYRIASLADRIDLVEDVRALLAEQWPRYMLEGHQAHQVDLESLLLDTGDRQVLLIDDQDRLCGAGFTVPLRWDGSTSSLPDGWDGAIVAGAQLVAAGDPGDTLCALSITVVKDRAGHGLAGRIVAGLKEVAGRRGAHSLVSPIRPTRKAAYPLIPLQPYLAWTDDRGETFDPWVRLHQRLGADVLAVAPRSMVVTGTVAEWEDWLSIRLPGSGSYVIQGGLAPLEVDRAADQGVYVEPNVWVRHRVGSGAVSTGE